MLTLLLVLITVLILIRHGSMFAPSAFFSLYWSIYALFTGFAFGWQWMNSLLFLFLMMAIAAVAFGDEFGLQVRETNIESQSSTNWLAWRALSLAALIGAFIHVFVLVTTEGYSVKALLSLDGILDAATSFSRGRYDGTYREHFVARIFLPCVFLCPLLIGHLLGARACHPRYRFVWLFLAIAPALAIAAVKTEKWPLAAAVSFAGSSFLVSRHFLEGEPVPSLRYFCTGLAGLVSLITVSIIACAFRLGSVSSDSFATAWDKLLSTAGSLIAFSNWLESYSFENRLGWGCNTFAGAFNAMGVATREQGLYRSFIELPNGETTNVFTFLRPLIDDFSIFGAMLYLFMIGFIWRLGMRRRWAAPTVFLIASCILSFNTSLFVHNSFPIAFLVYLGVVHLCGQSEDPYDDVYEDAYEDVCEESFAVSS